MMHCVGLPRVATAVPYSQVTYPLDSPSFGTLALPRGLCAPGGHNPQLSIAYNLITELDPHRNSRLLLRFARELHT